MIMIGISLFGLFIACIGTAIVFINNETWRTKLFLTGILIINMVSSIYFIQKYGI